MDRHGFTLPTDRKNGPVLGDTGDCGYLRMVLSADQIVDINVDRLSGL